MSRPRGWGRTAEHVQTARGVSLIARDRNIDSRTVVCPTCRADIGEPCHTSTGGVAHHPSRRRMAIRLINELADA